MPKLTLHNAYHYALCIMAFSFSFPFTLFPIGIALLAFTGVFLRIKEKNKAVDKRLAIFYVILFSYITLRIIGNDNLRYGLRVFERNLPLLIVPLLVIPNKIKQPKYFYRSFVLGIAFAGIVAMIGVGYSQVFVANEEAEWYFTAIYDYGFHPSFMAMYALIAIVILDQRNLFSQTWTILLSVFLSLFVVFSSSRMALIVLLLLLIIKAIISGKRIFYYGFVVVSILMATFYYISDDFRFKVNQLKDFQGFSYYDNNNYGSVSVRVAKIKASNMVWQENKWFGVGTGDYRDALVEKYRSKEIECWLCARERYHSHNQYLNILVAQGLVGLFLFAIWVTYLLYLICKECDSLLLGVLFIFLMFSLTDSILEVQRDVVVVYFLLYYIPIAKRIENEG